MIPPIISYPQATHWPKRPPCLTMSIAPIPFHPTCHHRPYTYLMHPPGLIQPLTNVTITTSPLWCRHTWSHPDFLPTNAPSILKPYLTHLIVVPPHLAYPNHPLGSIQPQIPIIFNPNLTLSSPANLPHLTVNTHLGLSRFSQSLHSPYPIYTPVSINPPTIILPLDTPRQPTKET